MIKHVVMWRLKEEAEGNEKRKNIELIKEKLFKLKDTINEINTFEIGENFNSSDAALDLVLITTHEDKDDLMGYVNHPEHREVASFIGKVVEERKVVDFEY